ncbi:CsbD family protein [Aquabacterium humicola]|uniref:CsbD family protein n=1 Tax=Aquabacterium humicola TaxID=3237377 RepID=UPI002542AF72|nr:CsbD family protein [Rubrivivax pictus]
MNRARIEGHWKQLKGRLRERWGRWTDDELAMIEGRREQLSGRIQERYGIARDEAERQLARWRHGAQPGTHDLHG